MKKDVQEKFEKDLRWFCDQALDNAARGTVDKEAEAELNKSLNETLESLGLVCKVNVGSGNTADEQGIAFVRKDVLGEKYANSEKPTPSKGVYIWFCYLKHEERFQLEFGYPRKIENGIRKKVDCKAFDDLEDDGCFDDENGKFREIYLNFEDNKEKIIATFLEMLDYYKRFKVSDFEIQPRPEIIAISYTDEIRVGIIPDNLVSNIIKSGTQDDAEDYLPPPKVIGKISDIPE